MINLHPTHQQLKAFVDGDCDPAMSLVISAHVDMCSHCQAAVKRLQEDASTEALSGTSFSPEFESMLADIMTLPGAEAVTVTEQPKQIELDGKQFTIPRALRRYVDHTGSWSKLLGSIWQAPVDLGPIGKANFIYMEKGGRVPEHTHRGNEMTLVLDGEFSDGHSHYDTGDFILMDQRNTHTPFSEADEGCLVFSIVDKPLHFTSGVARLLNPFSHLFF